MIKVSSGASHVFFLLEDGTVKCCGYNNVGQLGALPGGNLNTITVGTQTNVKQVSCSYNSTFFLLNDGSIRCCGANKSGELGLNSSFNQTYIVTNPNISGVSQIISSSLTTSVFFLMLDGSIKYLGYNVALGGDVNNKFNTVVGVSDVKQIAFGAYATFFLMNDGTVKCYGYNFYGQLGLSDNNSRSVLTDNANISSVKEIVCSNSVTFFLMEDGTVKGCGDNSYNQLGTGTYKLYYSIVNIPITNVKTISVGDKHTIFVLNDGVIKTCGSDSYGARGAGTSLPPGTITTNPDIANVSESVCGSLHTYFIMNDGSFKCCGYNAYGQLGIGSYNNSYYPVLMQVVDAVYPPYVTSFYPYNGTMAGGLSVTITGKLFVEGCTVKFGEVPATSVTFVNSTSIKCTTPPYPTASKVYLTVTNPDGQSAKQETTKFSFTAVPPKITSIYPSSSYVKTTSQVTITGEGFLENITVKFGTLSATDVIYISYTEIKCTIPSTDTASTVDVVVTNTDGVSATKTSGFSYLILPEITITNVSPNKAYINTEKEVILTGEGFSSATLVFFGSEPATKIEFDSSSRLFVITPSISVPSVVDFIVMNTIDNLKNIPNGFTFYEKVTNDVDVNISTLSKAIKCDCDINRIKKELLTTNSDFGTRVTALEVAFAERNIL